MNMDVIETLPKGMCERALWAREAFIEFPDKSEVDDNMLVWCFKESDGLWYSIAGNYSATSPQEKRDRELARELDEGRVKRQWDKYWSEYYKQVRYESEIRQEVLRRDKNKCYVCGKKATSRLHIHHILKRIKDGTDHLDNLVTVCASCHRKADSKLYDPDWTSDE